MPTTRYLASTPITIAAASAAMSGKPLALGAASMTFAVAVAVLTGRVEQAACSPTTVASAQASLTGRVVGLAAMPVTAAMAAARLTGKTVTLAGAPVTTSAATASCNGWTRYLAANPLTQATAQVFAQTFNPATRLLNALPVTKAGASACITGASDKRGMSLCQVVHELYMLWGIDCPKNAPKFAVRRALNDVNAALQMVWNQAENRSYWTNETITLTLTDGQNTLNLDDSIQNVVGPCRLASSHRALTPIGSINELENFADLYLDGAALATPIAYHIERLSQSGPDPARCIFHVTPTVQGANVNLLLDIVREAPRFTVEDLDTCPLIPIPHQYVETLLLPIARYRASGFVMLFTAKDQTDQINREYQEARVELGLADPLPGDSGDNTPKKEKPSK